MKKLLSLILVLFAFSLFYSCEDKAAIARQKKAEKRMKDSIRYEEKVVEYKKCTRLFGGLNFGMKKEEALASYNHKYWNYENGYFRLNFEGKSRFMNKLGLKEGLWEVYTVIHDDKDSIDYVNVKSHKTTANHLDELQEDCLSILCYFLNMEKYELNRDKFPLLSIFDFNDGEKKTFIYKDIWPFYVKATIEQEYDSPLYSYEFYISKEMYPVWK